MRTHISESEAERRADSIIKRELSTDQGYLNAENAEDQAWAEERIYQRVWRELETKYSID